MWDRSQNRPIKLPSDESMDMQVRDKVDGLSPSVCIASRIKSPTPHYQAYQTNYNDYLDSHRCCFISQQYAVLRASAIDDRVAKFGALWEESLGLCSLSVAYVIPEILGVV